MWVIEALKDILMTSADDSVGHRNKMAVVFFLSSKLCYVEIPLAIPNIIFVLFDTNPHRMSLFTEAETRGSRMRLGHTSKNILNALWYNELYRRPFSVFNILSWKTLIILTLLN